MCACKWIRGLVEAGKRDAAIDRRQQACMHRSVSDDFRIIFFKSIVGKSRMMMTPPHNASATVGRLVRMVCFLLPVAPILFFSRSSHATLQHAASDLVFVRGGPIDWID